MRLALAKLVDALPALAGFALATTIVLVRPGTWPGPAILWLTVPLAAFRLIWPVYTAFSFQVLTDAVGVTFIRGRAFRRATHLRWSTIVAAEVQRPFHLRCLGLAGLILRQAGDEAATIFVPALAADGAEALAARARGVEPLVVETSIADAAPMQAESPRTLYRATAPQLLLAAFAYGNLGVAGFAAVIGLYSFAEETGALGAVADAASSNRWAAIAVLLLTVVLAGSVKVLLQYGGFNVQAFGGVVRLSFGRLSQQTRWVSSSGIQGVVVRFNIFELMLRRRRLILLTTDSSGGLGSNLVLPSLPVSIVEEMIAALDLDLHGEKASEGDSTGCRLVIRWGVVSLAVLAGVLALVVGYSALLIGLALLVLLALHTVLARFAWSRVELSPSGRYWTHRQEVFTATSSRVLARSVQVTSIQRFQVRPCFVSLWYYAGGARVLRAWSTDPGLLRAAASLETATAEVESPRAIEGTKR